TNISQGHVSLQDPGAITQPYQQPTNFFGSSLAITGSVHLPVGDVLTYTSSDGPQYLEGFTYDNFDGHTWTTTSGTNTQFFSANQSLPLDANSSSKTVQLAVHVLLPPEGTIHYIFAPPQPATIDVATTITSNSLSPDGTTYPGYAMAIAWAQQAPLTEGETYHVTSITSTAVEQDLSAVPSLSDNPDFWSSDPNIALINTLYLQTPSGLSATVLKTAREWTQGATNSYDILKRLEAHFHDPRQFTYSVDNPAVPSSVDAVDWLLRTHRGYCTYYATAMIVMARLLGIPTRMVNGFSSGHYDPQHHRWMVQGSDAHSWVQAYFPGYGWINFDPTPGYTLNAALSTQPTRPVATPTSKKPTPKPTVTVPGTKKGTRPIVRPETPMQKNTTLGMTTGMALLLYLTVGALLFSVLFLLVALAVRWWRNLYPDSSLIAGTYWRLCTVASWIGLAPRRSQTPYEYSGILSKHVPQQAGTLWYLTDLFVRERWAAPQQRRQVPQGKDMERFAPRMSKLFLGLLWMKARKKG
ncbi:MAG: hypothetical protein M3Z24_01670, partial [Chloroflexota bacterium]|nr:hypothetical protein [Chloroflexota bacterium]